MDVVMVFFGIAIILFFGYFAELVFKRFFIPDMLFLIILGVILGKHGFGYIPVEAFESYAPLFTYFALLFLIFDGAFNIDLKSVVMGISSSVSIAFFNFFISAAAIAALMYLFKFPFVISILTGFILGGISSAYVLPLLKNLKTTRLTFSILTFESALTDVLCIVFSLTFMQIIFLNSLDIKVVFGHLISFFAVAGFMGILAGLVWIVILKKIPTSNKSYIMTIAFLILLYSATEFVGGNGAIAGLFFGIMLKNAKQLSKILQWVLRDTSHNVLDVVSSEEQFFYHQISFFLKTFFFVYVGLLLDLSNPYVVIIGTLISLIVFILRGFTNILTKNLSPFERSIINSIFGRGLAAAAIAQLAVQSGIQYANFISKVVYVVVSFTILFSSAKLFIIEKREFKKKLAFDTAQGNERQ